jgi:hypothetical protein
MPSYDKSFTPPAPVADVTVVHPTTGISSNILHGKLDGKKQTLEIEAP